MSTEYTVGQRIQFYRKGWSEDGKTPSIAINGTIVAINDGVARVEHRHGFALVKLGEESVNVLKPKGSRVPEEQDDLS